MATCIIYKIASQQCHQVPCQRDNRPLLLGSQLRALRILLLDKENCQSAMSDHNLVHISQAAYHAEFLDSCQSAVSDDNIVHIGQAY